MVTRCYGFYKKVPQIHMYRLDPQSGRIGLDFGTLKGEAVWMVLGCMPS